MSGGLVEYGIGLDVLKIKYTMWSCQHKDYQSGTGGKDWLEYSFMDTEGV